MLQLADEKEIERAKPARPSLSATKAGGPGATLGLVLALGGIGAAVSTASNFTPEEAGEYVHQRFGVGKGFFSGLISLVSGVLCHVCDPKLMLKNADEKIALLKEQRHENTENLTDLLIRLKDSPEDVPNIAEAIARVNGSREATWTMFDTSVDISDQSNMKTAARVPSVQALTNALIGMGRVSASDLDLARERPLKLVSSLLRSLHRVLVLVAKMTNTPALPFMSASEIRDHLERFKNLQPRKFSAERDDWNRERVDANIFENTEAQREQAFAEQIEQPAFLQNFEDMMEDEESEALDPCSFIPISEQVLEWLKERDMAFVPDEQLDLPKFVVQAQAPEPQVMLACAAKLGEEQPSDNVMFLDLKNGGWWVVQAEDGHLHDPVLITPRNADDFQYRFILLNR